MKHSTSTDCPIEILESRTMLSLAAPDVSFSGDGVNTYPLMASQVSYASAFDVQRDGSMVGAGNTFGRQRAGQILLARVNANGKADRSFGKAGKIITHFVDRKGIPIAARASGVRVQGNGKIIVAGSYGGNWAVFRFNDDGSLDRSFDRDGVKRIKSMNGAGPSGIELLRNGKILIAGAAMTGATLTSHASDFVMVRLNANGSLDRSFGNKGVVLRDFSARDHSMVLATDAKGNIATAGISNLSQDQPSLIVSRYRPDGTVDRSFGRNGGFSSELVGGSIANLSSLALLKDGRIMFSGSDGRGTFIMRLNRGGAMDSSFGTGGVRTFASGGFDEMLILQAGEQRVTALGVAHFDDASQDSTQVLMRLRGDGSDDPTFSARALTVELPTGDRLDGGARLLSGSRLTAFFTSRTNFADGDLTMARFDADGALDESFGEGGATKIDDSGPLRVTPKRIVTQSDGKALVLAQLDMYDYQSSDLLLRLSADGKIDRTFGQHGQVKLSLVDSFVHFSTMELDSAGKILLVAGQQVDRLNADGSVDKSFGNNGQIILPEAQGGIIVPLAGQKFFMDEASGGMGSVIESITRFNANGSIDTTYGNGGSEVIDFDSVNIIDHLLLGSDGSLTAVGTTEQSHDLGPSTDEKVFIVRYKLNGSPDNSFSQDGQLLIDTLQFTSDARLLPSGGLVLLSADGPLRKLKIIRYKADGSVERTADYQASEMIEGAFFDSDGRIIVLTKSSTVRLAADGSKIPSSSPGPAIPTNLVSAGFTVGPVRTITADHKLMLAGADAEGNLKVWRFLLD